MIKVEFVLYQDDNTFEVVESKEFLAAKDMFDQALSGYVYATVLKYGIKYNFASSEDAPDYVIRYIDSSNVVYEESMVEYVMNL